MVNRNFYIMNGGSLISMTYKLSPGKDPK